MEAPKLLTAAVVLCSASCLLPDGAAPAFGVQDEAEALPPPRDNRRSWLSSFQDYVWDRIKSSLPTATVFAFLFAIVLVGLLCCLTFAVGEPV
ncbi:small integral membrane protein 9 [Canis lupus familiaris]|uniref:small integral membrane protein 9 n=1 Tax=Canis lupus familiaris TaxID=9615 RepID=UPI0018F7DC38|nr:small integral membrane protein 9 [Canis lupus familiaris]